MVIDFTPWIWVNWAVLALTVGAFWTLGAFLTSAILAAIRRGA